MSQPKSHLDIYKLLPQDNCRECGLPTCLAFAVGVMQGRRELSQCPHVDAATAAQHAPAPAQGPSIDEERERAVTELCRRAGALDLAEAAERVRGRWNGRQLVVRCLGKDFALDNQGQISSQCHNIPWLTIPLLNYVLHCKGLPPTGRWTPLRDLPGGDDWKRLYAKRCEEPFKMVVDRYTGLFEDFVEVFAGRRAPEAFDSDIAVVLHPLPLLPLLVCYWKPEDGLGSSLNLFWDSTAADNLPVDAIYTLGVGLVTMFEKIALTHGC